MTRLDGIDVAHYQGNIDWSAVHASGVWWGATKATQSVAYFDSTFTVNRAGMARAGLRHRGLYHWLSPTSDPLVQARWFLAKIGSLQVGEFALLDAEESGINVSQVLQWCTAVEASTQRPCAVYSGAFVAGGTIWTDPRVRTSAHGRRPMALAAYTTEAKAKALPGVAANPWDSWQFTSSATVPGVPTRCDGNRVDSVAVYDLAAGLGQPAPQPTPTPTPVPTPKPLPDLGGVMRNGIIRVTDDGTTFVGVLNDKGAALEVRWTGPGSTDVFRWLDAHRAAGAVDIEVRKQDLINCCLNGPVPSGWTPSDFAPPSRG